MRAVVFHAFGPVDTLVIEECVRPLAGPGEVLMEVHAIGVNFTDVLVAQGRSQLQRLLPLTPGTEAAGIVSQVGPGVTRIRPGQRIFGTKTHGTYAEEVLFNEDEVAVIPEAMSFEDAATFYIASMNARYALELRAKLKAGENLLVLGAGGGVGLAAIQTGKVLGAHVVAAASSEEKLALARAAGADALVRYDRGPLDLEAQKALTAQRSPGKAGSCRSDSPRAWRRFRSRRCCSRTPISWVFSLPRTSIACRDATRAAWRCCTSGISRVKSARISLTPFPWNRRRRRCAWSRNGRRPGGSC
jgi:D-arabinose 1-dehydrogenase-like Zn-dependent alcohol dehydrogenase